MDILIVELIAMILGFPYMYISYRRESASGRNSVLWLFWGILLSIIIQLFNVLIGVFPPGTHAVLLFSLQVMLLSPE